MKTAPTLLAWIKAWWKHRLGSPRDWFIYHEREGREWLDEAVRRREQHDRIRQERDPRGGGGK